LERKTKAKLRGVVYVKATSIATKTPINPYLFYGFMGSAIFSHTVHIVMQHEWGPMHVIADLNLSAYKDVSGSYLTNRLVTLQVSAGMEFT
jgi:hypothetical protein